MFSVVTLLFIGTGIINCVAALQTFHLADFIEFYSSLTNCKEPDFVIKELLISYNDCVTNNLPKHPGIKRNEYIDFYSRACLNERAYRKCWEPIVKKSKECNSANGNGHPTSYDTVIKAVCKNDHGRSFADGLETALQSLDNENDEECSGSGEHWMVACKDLRIDARDVCKKHSEMTKCIEKISCKEKAIGRFFLDIYHEAGKISGCIFQNSTVPSIPQDKSHHRGS